MKILMLTSSFDIGGAETHILELTKKLVKRGHTVALASSGGEYVKDLERLCVKHFTFPLSSKNPLSILKSYSKLRKLLKENSFDVIHSHARLPSFICHFLAKMSKIPFVTTAHWVFSVRQPLKALSFWGEKSLSVSADIKNYLIDNYKIHPSNITLTVNGIDTESFRREKSADLKKTVVHVSRLDEGRSMTAFSLISIAEKLHDEFKDIRIEIVGSGNCEEKLRQKAKETNERLKCDVVVMRGKLTEVDKFLSSTGGIFVGVSRAALEAMSASYPVILSGNEGYEGIFDAHNPKEAILSNFCCRRGIPLSDDNLYRDIVYLLKNGEMAKDIGDLNRAFIEKRYSADKMANDALSLYNSVIKSKGSPSVIICGYYGYGNIGDEATLYQTVKRLRSQNITDITVLSRTPKKSARDFCVKSVYRYNLFKIIKKLQNADVFMLGGGNLLQNQTSNRSLYYYGALLRLAKRFGAKCFYYSSGIGELSGKREIEFTKNTLSLCEKITARTESDRKGIKEMSKKANVFTSPDAVFSYDEEDFSYLRLKYEFLRKQRYAVFAIREPIKERKNHVKALASDIARLHSEKSVLPIFVPFHRKKDERIAKEIIKKAGCGIIINPISLDEIIYLLRGAEFSSGMRMHLMVFSVIANTPFLSLSYDKKCADMYLYLKSKADELKIPSNFLKKAENHGYYNNFVTFLKESYNKDDMRTLCEHLRKSQINFF